MPGGCAGVLVSELLTNWSYKVKYDARYILLTMGTQYLCGCSAETVIPIAIFNVGKGKWLGGVSSGCLEFRPQKTRSMKENTKNSNRGTKEPLAALIWLMV